MMRERLGGRTKDKLDAFLAGRQYWRDQRTLGDNPYPKGSAEWDKFVSGFKAARADSIQVTNPQEED